MQIKIGDDVRIISAACKCGPCIVHIGKKGKILSLCNSGYDVKLYGGPTIWFDHIEIKKINKDKEKICKLK